MTMLRKCDSCKKRFRTPKAVCVETRKVICKRCCELHHEGCQHHYFCWANLM